MCSIRFSNVFNMDINFMCPKQSILLTHIHFKPFHKIFLLPIGGIKVYKSNKFLIEIFGWVHIEALNVTELRSSYRWNQISWIPFIYAIKFVQYDIIYYIFIIRCYAQKYLRLNPMDTKSLFASTFFACNFPSGKHQFMQSYIWKIIKTCWNAVWKLKTSKRNSFCNLYFGADQIFFQQRKQFFFFFSTK